MPLRADRTTSAGADGSGGTLHRVTLLTAVVLLAGALAGCGVQEQAGSVNAPTGESSDTGAQAQQEPDIQAVPGESTYTGGAGRTRDPEATGSADEGDAGSRPNGDTSGSTATKSATGDTAEGGAGARANGRVNGDVSGSAAAEAAGAGPDAGAFLQRAAQASLLELRSGELAREKAGSAEVQAYADAMIEAHAATGQALGALAQQRGVQMPDALDRQSESLMRRLNELEGAEFEHEYARQMRQAQQQTIQLYEDAAQTAQDPQVRSFARAQLPVLRKHLKMSESLSAPGRG